MNATGLGIMLRVGWRTHHRGIVIWVLALTGSMIFTAAGVAALYNTPAEIHSYATAVTSGNALAAINGKVEGIDSLGGVIQDEFGFLAAFLLPLLGIGLIARATRREEEAGRLELVLGGTVARQTPALAALTIATTAILVTSVAFAGSLAAAGVPLAGSVLYAAALGALAYTFTGIAALLAQLTQHSRGVYTVGLIVLATAYLLRGAGDVTKTWITWLSPLGWQEKAAPFGPQRWWTLAIPVAVGTLLAAAAARLAARRDLGSALIRGGAGPARATRQLRSPIGLATWVHRPAILGWFAGSVIFAGMMGALAQQLVDAMTGNPAMAEAIGASGGRLENGVAAVTQLYLAVIITGYVVQALGNLPADEAEGRLEPRLSGTLSRLRWLSAHAVVVLGGLLAIVVGTSLVFALTTAWSTGSTDAIGGILRAGIAYLPAELLLAGLALALFGLRPRAYWLAWAAYAAVAFITFLGPGLKLPSWALDLAPTTHIGNPPQGGVEAVAPVLLLVLTVALAVAGFAGFRRRGIPQS